MFKIEKIYDSYSDEGKSKELNSNEYIVYLDTLTYFDKDNELRYFNKLETLEFDGNTYTGIVNEIYYINNVVDLIKEGYVFVNNETIKPSYKLEENDKPRCDDGCNSRSRAICSYQL